VGGEERIITAVDNLHIELVIIAGVTAQGMLGNDRAGYLLVVGLNENAMFHKTAGEHGTGKLL
jgi:hypothetical protein